MSIMDSSLDDQTSQGTNLPQLQPQSQQSAPEDDSVDINKILDSTNLAPAILKKKGKEKLDEIGMTVRQWYERDLLSRKEWDDNNKEYMKLACQVMEHKSYPWPNASNVKFPILSTAALQFAARAYPSLVSGFDVVKARAIGDDPDGSMQTNAETISTHMSYQLLYEMEDWDEDMDKLCFILPIIGTCFKKTYYDPKTKTNKSELVLARDLVIDYWAKSLDTAHRKTHKIFRNPNEIIERQRAGLYIDDADYLEGASLDKGGSYGLEEQVDKEKINQQKRPEDDESTPRLILECHTFWDLDEDGYAEPYIITVDYESQKVLRITARFYKEGVEADGKKIVRIQPCEYFTKFGFIPNPDGGFYDLGFGLLLGGVNGAVNTLINQLIDAGTLSNLQGGFISKGIRLKQGEMRFTPGEWKAVNNFGDDLKKGIYPLPVKEPSNVLFELLGTLAQSGKELASIAEIFTGKMPGQNTPASTTMATVEQGLKVFTSIYKRIFRSLGQEFEKLYGLNRLYLPDNTLNINVEVAGEDKHFAVSKDTYSAPATAQGQQPFIRIVPAADPDMVSETQKLIKAQNLMQLMQLGTINPQELTKELLEDQGIANIKQLMTMPPPQPPVEVQIEQMKIQSNEKLKGAELQIRAQEVQLQQQQLYFEAVQAHSQAILNLANARKADAQESISQLEAELEQTSAMADMFRQHMESQQKLAMQQAQAQQNQQQQQQQHMMDLAQAAQQHQQEMQQNDQLHQQAMSHAEDQNQAQVQLMNAKAQAAGQQPSNQ